MAQKELKYCFLSSDYILTAKEEASEVISGYLPEYILRKLDEHKDKVLFVDGPTGETWDGKRIKTTIISIALGLLDMGLGFEDVVCGYLPNEIIYYPIQHAIMSLGAIFTGIHWEHPYRELKHQVDDSRSKFLFIHARNYEVGIKTAVDCPTVKFIIVVGSDVRQARKTSIGQDIVPLQILLNRKPKSDDLMIPLRPKKSPEEAIAAFLYSSGSTGKPKGVKRSHKNCLAMLGDDNSKLGYMGLDDDIVVCHSPFPHMSGFMAGIQAITQGKKTIINDHFELENWLQTVQKYGVTYVFLAPSYMVLLTKSDLVSKYDLSSLKKVVTGGAMVPESVIDVFIKKLDLEQVIQAYGSTEAGMCSFTPPDCNNPFSAGSVRRNIQLKVVDRNTGLAVGPNVTGEFYAKGPEVSPGYFNNPQADADNFENGWSKTGDAGYYDEEGLLWIVSRVKDMIKVGIAQVSPAEIESILLTHELIEEAAVIAIPHEIHGEVPKVFITLKTKRNNNHLTEDEVKEILEYANSQLGEWKQLKGGLQVLDIMPKIGMGKLDKVTLKRMPY